jgi:hypothetical protein
MKGIMRHAPPATARRNPPAWPLAAGNDEGPRAGNRLFDRVAVGFWLGGAGLGTVGCLAGAAMPYRHPAAVTISVIWWGIYLGCLGAWAGALFGMWSERAAAARSSRAEGAQRLPPGALARRGLPSK